MKMRFSFLIIFNLCLLNAANTEEQYLEAKRQQLETQIRQFDEAKQALEAYKASFEALQKERLDALVKKEAEVNASLAKIESLKAENERIMKQSEATLNAIHEKTTGRVKEIYSQMKDQAIADVLSQMNSDEASRIMLSLEPRKISGVLSKMQPAKASELTLLIKNLDENASKDNNSSN